MKPTCNPPSSHATCSGSSSRWDISTTKGFPSYTLPLPPRPSSRFCYSVTLETPGLAQVGFARPSFSPDPSAGKGCGDDSDSWGYDGSRVFKWHEGGTRWGWPWSTGSVVWLGHDPDKGEVYATVDGKGPRLGEAGSCMFDGVWGRLWPCVTVNKSCRLTVDFSAALPGWRSVRAVKESGREGGTVRVDAWAGDALRPARKGGRGQGRAAGGLRVDAPPPPDGRVWAGDALEGNDAVAFEKVKGTMRYKEPKGWVKVAAAESGVAVYRPVPHKGYRALGCVLREEGEEKVRGAVRGREESSRCNLRRQSGRPTKQCL